MLNKKYLVGTLASFSLLFGTISRPTFAQSPEKTAQFQRIEQPMGLKISATSGKLALIASELWWFLFSQTKFA